MIQIEWNKKKLNSLYKKMDSIANKLPSTVQQGLKQGLEGIQKLAYDYKRGKKEGILINITKENSTEVIGKVYTDKDIMPYALFLEFGTGTYAEMEHIGVTKTFIESGFRYWYLPVEKATRDFGDSRKIKIGDMEFYIMYAQQPKPFMRPAGFNGRDSVTDAIQDTLYRMMKEICK